MTTNLTERLLKGSKLKAKLLNESTLWEKEETVPTPVFSLNISLSGSLDGGVHSGITTIAGESRHFKSTIGLVMAKAYLDRYPEAVMLFYDSEGGIPQDYFTSAGIDPERVIYQEVFDIEQLKFDVVGHLTDNIQENDKVLFFVDSIGNLASKKETDDAIDGKSVADMSRAKAIKSLFRLITPRIKHFKLPFIQIAHIYQTMDLYPQDVVSGGKGIMLASNTTLIVKRQQEKQGKEVIGYNFNLVVDKSRFVREKSKVPISVTFEGGINQFGGLLDIAIEGGYVLKPKVGWYTRSESIVSEDKNWRQKDTECVDFWKPIFSNSDFKEYVKRKYKLSNRTLIGESGDTEEA